MKNILLVSPTVWDQEELAEERLAGAYRMTVLRDGNFHWPRTFGLGQALRRFDVFRAIDAALEQCRGMKIHGVVGTDEFLACAIAAVLARRMDLPGPAPAAMLRAMHKYYSRLAQREAVPEATAGFTLINPLDLSEEPRGVSFPMFVKPVRGTYSVLAQRMDSMEALRRFLSFSLIQRAVGRSIMRPFNQLLARYTDAEYDANFFIGEQILEGSLVTVEGYVQTGDVSLLGVVDASMYPGTNSFARFDYPSRHPAGVLRRMGEIAARVVKGLSLDHCLFNVEMFWRHETDSIHVLEVNPRMAYQFADLYEKVDGINSYDVQLALATGDRPPAASGFGRFRAAASFVMRRFEDARILSLPGAPEIATVKARFPGVRVRLYGRRGARLSEQKGCESYRYAIVNLGGADREELDNLFIEAGRHLTFNFG